MPELAPYQTEAYRWLETHDRAWLGMGCGLGKTAVCIKRLEDELADFRVRRALVVAPKRVSHITWPAELAKWAPWIRWHHLANGPSPAGTHVDLVNYESLHKLKDRYDLEIWDETTFAKNPSGKRIRAARKHLGDTPLRWGLTGTPAPNGLLDLFGQARLLDDGKRLGRAYTQYMQRYFYPTDYMKYNWVPKKGSEEKIYETLADLMLVMKTSDYLDLPDMVMEDIEVELPDEVRKQLRELKREFLIEVKGGTVIAPSAATLINKMLQIAGGFVYHENGYDCVHQAKIKAIPKVRPLLVAANYRHEMAGITAAYPEAELWEGPTTATRWNAGEIPMLVIHPKSAGHGLNLQGGGCNVCWFSPTWNREHYDQLNARLYRRGQEHPVVVHRIIAKRSADEAVIEALRSKDETQTALLNALRSLS